MNEIQIIILTCGLLFVFIFHYIPLILGCYEDKDNKKVKKGMF